MTSTTTTMTSTTAAVRPCERRSCKHGRQCDD
jgi:hypothetical protein